MVQSLTYCPQGLACRMNFRQLEKLPAYPHGSQRTSSRTSLIISRRFNYKLSHPGLRAVSSGQTHRFASSDRLSRVTRLNTENPASKRIVVEAQKDNVESPAPLTIENQADEGPKSQPEVALVEIEAQAVLIAEDLDQENIPMVPIEEMYFNRYEETRGVLYSIADYSPLSVEILIGEPHTGKTVRIISCFSSSVNIAFINFILIYVSSISRQF